MNCAYVFKKCTKCGEILPATKEYFHKQKSGKYGLKGKCKKCRAEQSRQYYQGNKERIAEHDRQYYQDNKEAILEQCKKYRETNKEAIAERGRQYYQANKEALAERHRQYREQNKEARAEYSRQWYQDNKERIAEHDRQYYQDNKERIAEQSRRYHQSPQGQVVSFNGRSRRRAKEQAQGRGITKEQWLEMMSFFNWECAYSGKTLTKETRSIDHIDPLNNGGENEVWNCVPMDKSLNCSKQDREMLDWYIKQPFCSAERLLKIYKWQEYAFNKWGIDTEAQ